MLQSYEPQVSLLIEAHKWCISEECVIYTLGVGEGHDDLDQVHPGKIAHTNEVHSLFKWDLYCGRNQCVNFRDQAYKHTVCQGG